MVRTLEPEVSLDPQEHKLLTLYDGEPTIRPLHYHHNDIDCGARFVHSLVSIDQVDANLPESFACEYFPQGWAMLDDGELLTAAEFAGFVVFVTTDKNIRYQQNLARRRIAIVIIGYARWPGLEPHVDRVVAAVDEATPGSFIEVEIPGL